MIDSIRYSCYNNEENRTIATILYNEEYCDVMLELSRDECAQLQNQVNLYKSLYMDSQTVSKELLVNLDDCINLGDEYKTNYEDSQYRLKRSNRWLLISATVNVALLTILLL